jgi:hypothetical protein
MSVMSDNLLICDIMLKRPLYVWLFSILYYRQASAKVRLSVGHSPDITR